MGKKVAKQTAFACNCGKLFGSITARGVQYGTHVVCFCRDCRAAQIYFGQPDPAPEPVDIFQMAPEEIRIDGGIEHLAAMRLGPKGMLRWYASCCNAPLATTSNTPKFPFAGFDVKRVSDPDCLGPVTTQGFIPQADGKHKHKRLGYAVAGIVTRVLKSRLSGSWRDTPFFDQNTGQTISTPVILSKEQRKALYA